MGPAVVGENVGASHITANHLQTHTDGGLHALNHDKTKLNRDKTDHLYIGTFNVENVKGNYIYVSELRTHCDILCIQEHWLYTPARHI